MKIISVPTVPTMRKIRFDTLKTARASRYLLSATFSATIRETATGRPAIEIANIGVYISYADWK